MTTWTSVAGVSTTYTRVTFPGTQIYDDPNVTYDDASAFYESDNPALWSKSASVVTTWTSIASA